MLIKNEISVEFRQHGPTTRWQLQVGTTDSLSHAWIETQTHQGQQNSCFFQFDIPRRKIIFGCKQGFHEGPTVQLTLAIESNSILSYGRTSVGLSERGTPKIPGTTCAGR
jgi:hypothetical protein